MTITAVQTIHTDAKYASEQAERTFAAYWHARDVQDIIHELTVCLTNGVNAKNRCKWCVGCTFKAFLLSSPHSARLVAEWVNTELQDKSGRGYFWSDEFNDDLSGLGKHVALIARDNVFGSEYNNLHINQLRYIERMTANIREWDKLSNRLIWEYFAELIEIDAKAA